MKVFVNGKVYVQKNDLALFLKGVDGKPVPRSIFEKIFGDIFIVDDSNRYDFVEFSSPEEVKFFQECDWIVDYNDFDGMSEERIIECAQQVNYDRNQVAIDFNELPESERVKQYDKTGIQIELLEYKMWSIRDILWHKKGHLAFPLPDGARVSYLMENNAPKIPEEETSVPEEIAPKKQSVFQKVFNRFRKNPQ